MAKTVNSCIPDLFGARQAKLSIGLAGRDEQISEPASVDNILVPRRRPYTREELLCLARMVPMSELPPHCIAEENTQVQPPVFIRGWIIDLEHHCREARARNLEEFLFRRVLPPDWASHQDPRTITLEKVLDSLGTSENHVRTVIEEDPKIMDLPVSMYVHIVWGCTPDKKKLCSRYAISIYDNYNMDRRPSAEDEQRIRDALGLTGEPEWFADAPLIGAFRWYYWDEDDYDEDY